MFELCLSAETSPKIQGGTERLTIDKRQVPELKVPWNRNTEPTTGQWLLVLLLLLLLYSRSLLLATHLVMVINPT